MTLPKPTDSEALIQSHQKAEALEQQARDLAHSVETVRQQTLAQSNERIEALEKKALDLASFVETTRQQILLQSDKKTEALEQKARDLADFVETLRNQTRLQSDKKIAALGEKARDLAHFVESVRKETRLQFDTEIAALGKKARDLAVSVETVREMTLLQSNSEIAMLGQSQAKTAVMNEALVLGSLRQHELTEAAENLNAKLQTEITERKRAEDKVRVSEIRYRRLFEAAHNGILLLDSGTRKITDANPFMTKLLGYTHAQLIGKELFEIGLLKDEAASREMFQKLKRQHEVRYEDLPLESQQGRHQEVEVVANLYQESGHAVIQCNIRDITARKQAEIILNRLAAIVEFSDDAMIGKDPKGIITSWNNGAEKIFGYAASEMVGASIMRLIPIDRRHEEKQILAKIKQGESLQHFETLRQTKDGRLINVSVTISPIKDATGRVIGVSKVARDITERTQAEQAQRRIEVLAASNRKLEKEIVRRQTVEESLKQSEQDQSRLLAESRQMQEQLRQLSRQVLMAQEEERKRISRELHDVIAQTLTGINIRLATLKKEAGRNTKGFDITIARTQRLVEKSVNLVHDFARELRPAVLDDLGLIPALHTFMKNFTGQTGVRTRLTAFAEVEKLESSGRTVLFRIAQESLTNVARHAKASRVEVDIRKFPDSICMKINDDGKSFKVDRALHTRSGKRLGLLGMRERLEMIGGSFEVESSPGKGTTIIAQIPLPKRGGGGGKSADKVR